MKGVVICIASNLFLVAAADSSYLIKFAIYIIGLFNNKSCRSLCLVKGIFKMVMF